MARGSRGGGSTIASGISWSRCSSIRPDETRNPGRERYPPRACFEGVLYLLYAGLRYVDLPRHLSFPSGETCRRRLHEWIERGVWTQALSVRVAELDRRGRLDWWRVVVDASLVDAR